MNERTLQDLLNANDDDDDFMGNDMFQSVPFIPSHDVMPEEWDDDKYPTSMPLLPLRNTILFPAIIVPITIGRDRSLKAIQKAYDGNGYIGVIGQREDTEDEPSAADLFEEGTIGRVVRIMEMPNGDTAAIIQGRKRFKIDKITRSKAYLTAKITVLEETELPDDDNWEAMMMGIRDAAARIIHLSPNIPNDAAEMVQSVVSDYFLLSFLATNARLDTAQKQELLRMDDIEDRATELYKHLLREREILELREKIETKTRAEMDNQQREYYLQQQVKAIQEELGNGTPEDDLAAFAERGAKMNWGEATAKAFERELKKLRRSNPMQPDYSMGISYIETLLDLPWGIYTTDNFDLHQAAEILERDHFGLEKIKERILEHLAILKLRGDLKAPILCLVGPPGVGKTSLGKSVADALGRKYIRMALGGISDEAEIRGHRRTYLGSMPGRIVQSLKKIGALNPVFILDEIDKVGSSHRGDPSSALLEALDPEQNNAFSDNYLDVDFDLSKVLFIATANTLDTIQPALLDRMEIIRLSGYSTEEKTEIARRHLIPNQIRQHGLTPEQLIVAPDVLQSVIQNYTREAGVRELERKIAAICRNTAKKVANDEPYTATITYDAAAKILGVAPFSDDDYAEAGIKGVAVGLAWTSVGGEILYIETAISPGKGGLTLTGSLGDVMKESATTALTFLRSNAATLGIAPEAFEKHDIHIHVPEGGIPKDGPSAGITMLTALASAFTGRTVKPYLAMTGEITLRGKVLPIGGLKEKLLAAKRAGIKEIILCKANTKDVAEVTPVYLEGLTIHYVERMVEVLEIALV